MRIGELASTSGVSIDTIRFWERRGVLPTPSRTTSGYRLYSETALARISRTRELQALGLTLDEVISALRAQDEGNASCASQRWRLEAALDRVEAKIAELTKLRGAMRGALAACDAGACHLADPL